MNMQLDNKKNLDILESKITQAVLPDNIVKVFELVRTLGKGTIFLVGSAPRDILLGNLELNDLDFIGDFDLDAIQQFFGDQVIARWDQFKTVKVRWNNIEIDFIARPAVKMALQGGDITLSQFCIDIEGNVYDPLAYYSDFQNKIVRIDNAREKIKQSPERILRVLRFAAELGYEIDADTRQACIENVNLMTMSNIEYALSKILKSSPKIRLRIIEIAEELGILDFIMEIIVQRSELIIREDSNMKAYIESLQTLLGTSSFFIFGGALRDVILERQIKDVDIKFETSHANIEDIVTILKGKGFIETTDVSLPVSMYYINMNFNVISFRLDGIVYDISFVDYFDLATWRINCDINLNALIFDNSTSRLLNKDLSFFVAFRILRLCSLIEEGLDPLKIVNALKQMSKIEGLTVDIKTIAFIKAHISLVREYIDSNRKMRYKLRSIMGNPFTPQVIEFIMTCPEGSELLQLLEV